MEILDNDPPGPAPERVDFVRDLVFTGHSDDDIEALLGPAGRAEANAIRRHEDLTPEARAGRRSAYMEKLFRKIARAVLSAEGEDLRTLINGANAITRLNKAILDTDTVASGEVPAGSAREDAQPADDPDAEETQNGKFDYGTGPITKGSAGRAMDRDARLAELRCFLPGVETKSRPISQRSGPAGAVRRELEYGVGGAFSHFGQTVPAPTGDGRLADMADDGRARLRQDASRR